MNIFESWSLAMRVGNNSSWMSWYVKSRVVDYNLLYQCLNKYTYLIILLDNALLRKIFFFYSLFALIVRRVS